MDDDADAGERGVTSFVIEVLLTAVDLRLMRGGRDGSDYPWDFELECDWGEV